MDIRQCLSRACPWCLVFAPSLVVGGPAAMSNTHLFTHLHTRLTGKSKQTVRHHHPAHHLGRLHGAHRVPPLHALHHRLLHPRLLPHRASGPVPSIFLSFLYRCCCCCMSAGRPGRRVNRPPANTLPTLHSTTNHLTPTTGALDVAPRGLPQPVGRHRLCGRAR